MSKTQLFDQTNFELNIEAFKTRCDSLFSTAQAELIEQSYLALKADECLNVYSNKRVVHALNVQIATDPEPEAVTDVKELTNNSQLDELLRKKALGIQRSNRRRRAKAFVNNSRKCSKK